MVREGERKGEEDMRIEGKVPFRVVKKGVKFAKGGVEPFIAPSEPAVLEMNLAILQGGPEAIYTATADIGFVLFTPPVDLIEVSEGHPFDPSQGF
jgi:hypothetical protein